MYKRQEIHGLVPSAHAVRWPAVEEWFAGYEVPQGCLVELPAIVTYCGFALRERRDSPFWHTVVTEWCVNAAKNLLWEAYDRFYLWFTPELVVAGIRYLAEQGALDLPLGGTDNVAEMLALLAIAAATRWDTVPRDNRHRTPPPPCAAFSPGRVDDAGDFIYIDPWSRVRISCAEARVLGDRRAGRSGPGALSRRLRAPRASPVSYTHLTLPTTSRV